MIANNTYKASSISSGSNKNPEVLILNNEKLENSNNIFDTVFTRLQI